MHKPNDIYCSGVKLVKDINLYLGYKLTDF